MRSTICSIARPPASPRPVLFPGRSIPLANPPVARSRRHTGANPSDPSSIPSSNPSSTAVPRQLVRDATIAAQSGDVATFLRHAATLRAQRLLTPTRAVDLLHAAAILVRSSSTPSVLVSIATLADVCIRELALAVDGGSATSSRKTQRPQSSRRGTGRGKGKNEPVSSYSLHISRACKLYVAIRIMLIQRVPLPKYEVSTVVCAVCDLMAAIESNAEVGIDARVEREKEEKVMIKKDHEVHSHGEIPTVPQINMSHLFHTLLLLHRRRLLTRRPSPQTLQTMARRLVLPHRYTDANLPTSLTTTMTSLEAATTLAALAVLDVRVDQTVVIALLAVVSDDYDPIASSTSITSPSSRRLFEISEALDAGMRLRTRVFLPTYERNVRALWFEAVRLLEPATLERPWDAAASAQRLLIALAETSISGVLEVGELAEESYGDKSTEEDPSEVLIRDLLRPLARTLVTCTERGHVIVEERAASRLLRAASAILARVEAHHGYRGEEINSTLPVAVKLARDVLRSLLLTFLEAPSTRNLHRGSDPYGVSAAVALLHSYGDADVAAALMIANMVEREVDKTKKRSTRTSYGQAAVARAVLGAVGHVAEVVEEGLVTIPGVAWGFNLRSDVLVAVPTSVSSRRLALEVDGVTHRWAQTGDEYVKYDDEEDKDEDVDTKHVDCDTYRENHNAGTVLRDALLHRGGCDVRHVVVDRRGTRARAQAHAVAVATGWLEDISRTP
jgi:hypothetical protein